MTDVTFRDQLDWEKQMINFGVARFRAKEDKAAERKDYNSTNGGKRLLNVYLSQVSEFISSYCAGDRPTGRIRHKYTKMLKPMEPDKLALFALTEMLVAVFEETALASVAHKVGVMVEDELKFTHFAIEKPELFDALQRDLDSRNSESYRHRHRVLTHSMNKHNIDWTSWGSEVCVGVGQLVLSLAMDASDWVTTKTVRQGRKTITVLSATDEIREWIAKSDEALAVLLPDRMPCLIPPEDWTSVTSGGYHLPRLRASTQLVKVRRGLSRAPSEALFSEADIAPVMAAVNGMQRTPWRVNKRVLAAMQEVWAANLGTGMPASQPYEVPKSPIEKGKKELTQYEQELLDDWKQEAREVYALEKLRTSLVLGVSRTMRIGQLLADKEEFYFVYQTDFRGRVYATTSGVSPQGGDHSKGVLEFGTAKPLGERGGYWLKVHGANKYGYDKCSNDERVAWIDARRDELLGAAADPIGNRHVWADADKPYQFLAFCFEYAGYVQHGSAHRSRLPIALDGSCNGLQHFSAMLRDPIGGRAVNLTPPDNVSKPADIYQDVADVTYAKLGRLAAKPATTDEELGARTAAMNWLALFKKLGYEGMPRKASKKPVMTLPYGSTAQACTSSLFSWYKEQQVDFFPEGTAFRHCILLSKLLWSSIGEVVVAARVAMDWIQKCASQVSKENVPLVYTSVLGFPVYQGSRKQNVIRIVSRIGGARLRLNVSTELEDFDSRKQRQGSSPNLVHHIDATHMLMCIIAGLAEGICCFAMIHDDFGVHACHIERWHEIIREQFVKLHSENDLLDDFRTALVDASGLDLPEVPPTGSLDLTGVLKSPYFFG